MFDAVDSFLTRALLCTRNVIQAGLLFSRVIGFELLVEVLDVAVDGLKAVRALVYTSTSISAFRVEINERIAFVIKPPGFPARCKALSPRRCFPLHLRLRNALAARADIPHLRRAPRAFESHVAFVLEALGTTEARALFGVAFCPHRESMKPFFFLCAGAGYTKNGAGMGGAWNGEGAEAPAQG
jgi:hypothetical protein